MLVSKGKEEPVMSLINLQVTPSLLGEVAVVSRGGSRGVQEAAQIRRGTRVQVIKNKKRKGKRKEGKRGIRR